MNDTPTDTALPPHIEGGQGRKPEEIEAGALLWGIISLVVGAVLVVGYLALK